MNLAEPRSEPRPEPASRERAKSTTRGCATAACLQFKKARDVAGARDAYSNALKDLKPDTKAYNRWAPSLWVAWAKPRATARVVTTRRQYPVHRPELKAPAPRRRGACLPRARVPGSAEAKTERPEAVFEAFSRLLPPSKTTGRRDRSASCLLLGLAKAKQRIDDEDYIRHAASDLRRAAASS